MAKRTVGFIGLGLMGRGMAKNILTKGNDLLAMAHRNRAPIEEVVAMGASEVKTPREMAGAADAIVICVTGSPEVERVMRGPDGILAGARRGLIVIETSTADPTSTAALAAEFDAIGGSFVDAPLFRTPKEAEEGKLGSLVGGTEEDLDAVRPIVECYSDTIIHVGARGAGHTMKLINNFVSLGYAAIYSEALALCARTGISAAKFHEVIGGGRMRCGFYDGFMKYVVDGDRDAHKFTLRNAHKDMRYFANLATAAGATSLIAPMVRGYLASAEAMGKGDDFLPMLADHAAELNGVKLG
jgi:3-hydroxyisobutyrate dehydrogenase-like beta-hydroxyacid dehydrogenase